MFLTKNNVHEFYGWFTEKNEFFTAQFILSRMNSKICTTGVGRFIGTDEHSFNTRIFVITRLLLIFSEYQQARAISGQNW